MVAEASRRRRRRRYPLERPLKQSVAHRGAWRLATVLAFVLAAAACGSTSPLRPASASPSSTAAVQTAPAPYSWSRSSSAALRLGGGTEVTVSAVLAPTGGRRWLMAGTVTSRAGTDAATLWRSSNALSWTRTTLPGADARALGASNWGSRLVVVGSTGSGAGTRAAVWVSAAPGQPWVNESVTAAGGSSGAQASAMTVVAAGTLGAFAAGTAGGAETIWYSSNGSKWSQASGANRLLSAEEDPRIATMLVDSQGVYAAGTVLSGTRTEGGLWHSSDGIAWSALSPAGNPFGGGGDHRIDSLVQAGTSIVALGAVRHATTWTPASWISPNGSAWSQPSEAFPMVSGTGALGGGVARSLAVDRSTGALVAVGGDATSQHVWSSASGQTWSADALPPSVAHASGWSADLVATAGGVTVVADSMPGQPHVLVDAGGRWRDLTATSRVFGSPVPVAEPVSFVHLGSQLLLAVDVSAAPAAIGDPTTSAVVLASADGASWRLLAGAASFAGARLSSVVDTAGGLVAVGVTSAGATMWTSADGAHWSAPHVLAGAAPAATGRSVATSVTSSGTSPVVAGTGPAGEAGPPAALAWGSGAATVLSAPAAGYAQPTGSCAVGSTVVVVGSATRTSSPAQVPAPGRSAPASTSVDGSAPTLTGQGDIGSEATAWWSGDGGVTWHPATVAPASGVGAAASMDGCMAVGTGFVAWGQAPVKAGAEGPALWRSAAGSSWTLLSVPSLASQSHPVGDVSASGTSWVAVSGAPPASVAAELAPSSRASALLEAAAEPVSATSPDGPAGLWVSADAGTTWSRVQTAAPAWAAGQALTLDLAGWSAQTPVVAGQVDGQLAVWTGSPTG